MGEVEIEVAAALDTEVEVVAVVDVTEDEFMRMFALCLNQYGYDRRTHGEIRYPTLAEARERLARSPYNRG